MGPAKHSCWPVFAPLSNKNALADREWKSFQNDFSEWQQASSAIAERIYPDPCKAHRYSRCIDSLKARKP